MSFLWESVKVTAQMAGNAAKVAGQKTKLKGEVILVDREIVARKRQFGVELYDYVSPLASNPDFFAADDKMTNTVRGPMLKTQREIAALLQKRTKLKEKLAQAEVTRKAAFPTAAANIGEKVMNTGKAAGFAANETKIQTEIGMIDTQINAFKQEFGLELYEVFVQLEDNEGWLPTIRDVRSMYDQARREVDKLRAKKEAKEKEILSLGGSITPPRGGSRQNSPTPPTWSGATEEADTPAGNGSSSTGGAAAAAAAASPYSAPVTAASSSGYGSTTTTSNAHQTQQQAQARQPATSFSDVFGNTNPPAASAAPTTTATSAPPPYDPFSSSPPPQQSSAPGYDPFSLQQQQPQQQSTSYDPFSAPQPASQQPAAYDPFSQMAASNNNQQRPNDNDPFAGL